MQIKINTKEEIKNFKTCLSTKGENWPPEAEYKTVHPIKKNIINIVITSQLILLRILSRLIFLGKLGL